MSRRTLRTGGLRSTVERPATLAMRSVGACVSALKRCSAGPRRLPVSARPVTAVWPALAGCSRLLPLPAISSGCPSWWGPQRSYVRNLPRHGKNRRNRCKDLLGERYVTTEESATFDHSTYCFTNTEFFSVLLTLASRAARRRGWRRRIWSRRTAGHVVGFGDEAVDRGLKVDHRSEEAAFEPVSGELGKQAFNRIGPGAGSRGVVEGEASMPLQPSRHLGMLVSSVVVEHDVDRFVGRHLALDGIEKADEFLMPVALHTAPDDLAFKDVEGGEQGGGAVALVIVCHRGTVPLVHRQPGLGAIERLDLAFLVDAEDHRMGRRIT